jgi:hypothetical protein
MPLHHPLGVLSCPFWYVGRYCGDSIVVAPLVLHTWPGHGLVICLVTAIVGQQRRPRFLPCWSAWRELGRTPRLVGMLRGDLVVRRAEQACSVGTWLFIPPCGLARRGLGHTPHLTGLPNRDLVVRPAFWTC